MVARVSSFLRFVTTDAVMTAAPTNNKSTPDTSATIGQMLAFDACARAETSG